MRKAILLVFVIGFITTSSAQRRRSTQRPYWSTQLMLSSATFLSDLGGKNFYGSNDPSDIDLKDIRYAFGVGFQYHRPKGFSIGLSAFYSRLSADDAETDWDRKFRNLHVRTDIVEVAIKAEYTFPQNSGALRGFYFNLGGGLTFFRPMAELNGIWYELRPFGTEGQNLDPTHKPYKSYSPVIPFGIGKKFYLRNGMMLGFDISMRKSFTDYLDDVSTEYFDKELIRAKSGDAAAHFADPSNNGEGGVGRIGFERGNPDRSDNYFLMGLRLEIPLGRGAGGNYNTSCSFGNSWIRSNGSLPKISRKGKRRKVRLFR
ncbi:MAG: hypothetical protein COA58_06600 [Bacteroidetes bacterium]|nr:MAG: hypothetical protein COA58_06600 [Bacteroidota bacterium]